MGKASRLKRERKAATINDAPNFFDYFLSPQSDNDLLPLDNELIDKLVIEKKMPKEDLLYMASQGYLYSLSRRSFILLEMG